MNFLKKIRWVIIVSILIITPSLYVYLKDASRDKVSRPSEDSFTDLEAKKRHTPAKFITDSKYHTDKGAAYGTAGGAAAGALAGQLIGKNTKSTLIGAAVGAAVGGSTGLGADGQMIDKQEQEFRQALAASEAASLRRKGNLIDITLKVDAFFYANSATIKPELYSEIHRIAQVMAQYPQIRVSVDGHTDSQGKESYNMELSRKQAESVMNLLIQSGVNSSQIQTVAYGETMPVASNDTVEGRQRNRRIEIKIEPKSVD